MVYSLAIRIGIVMLIESRQWDISRLMT